MPPPPITPSPLPLPSYEPARRVHPHVTVQGSPPPYSPPHTRCVRPHVAIQGVPPQKRVRDELGEGADVVHVAHEPGRHGQHEARDETATPGDGEVQSHLIGVCGALTQSGVREVKSHLLGGVEGSGRGCTHTVSSIWHRMRPPWSRPRVGEGGKGGAAEPFPRPPLTSLHTSFHLPSPLACPAMSTKLPMPEWFLA